MTAVAAHSTHVKKSRPITPQYYLEIIRKTASFNSSLASERKQRLPFIDSQTGVAQSHSNLWHPYRARGPGERGGQIYTYPAKRWKKKKRSFPLPEVRLTKLTDLETGEAGTYMHQISAVENPAASGSTKEDYKDGFEETYKEAYSYQYYDDWDHLSEPLDAGEIDARHSDSSDFEDTYIKKRSKKKPKNKGGRGRKKDMKEPLDDADKPYSCDHCGARYKTRPGLSYHVTHSHNMPKKKDLKEREAREAKEKEREREAQQQQQQQQQQPAHVYQDTPPASISYDDDTSGDMDYLSGKTRGNTGRAAAAAATVAMTVSAATQNEVSRYCDFCLGDALENKKTGDKEELVSCADCGRSGHPSCLQFTANMIISVKKYPWQCIECKSCGLCGTSDNDDQLLFCDDCDRGYHMYCLKPPLSEPPEGSWSCHLCIIEFYGGKKADNGEATTTTIL